MSPDEQAIRDVHNTWIAAVNAGDLACLLGLMADDVVFLNPGREPFGREGFTEGFEGAHRQYGLRCVSEQEEITVAGDMAYTLCRDSLSITPRDGGATEKFAGNRLTVYRKQLDGRWMLARDAHTLLPVAD
ncbi:MAG TPA: SgcJ/EcaC family oxidoreductase [Burkholderiaceae bacterium]|jgi:uncharacterized protein (TIGR02246 family)